MKDVGSGASNKRRGILRWIQGLWLALVLFFVAAAFTTQWHHVASYDWNPSFSYLVLALLFALLRKLWGGVLWAYLVSTVSKTPVRGRFRQNMEVYFVTNLASYLPGSLWYIPWRMKINRDAGISLTHTSIGSALESLMLVISNGLLGLPILATMFSAGAEIDPRLLIGIAVVGLLLAQPVVLRFLFLLMKRALGRDLEEPRFDYRQILTSLGLALIAALTAGASIFFLIRSIYPSLSADAYLFLNCSFALAWVTGFVTPIAPAGLGVREGLLVWLFGQQMPLPVATVAAVAIRLIFVVEDLFWAALVMALRRLRKV